MTLSSSQKRIVASLIENKGNVGRAAGEIRVSKQYIYEVLRRLKKRGVRFVAIPMYRSLGLTPLLLIQDDYSKEPPGGREYLIGRFRIFGFDGAMYYVSLYSMSGREGGDFYREAEKLSLECSRLLDVVHPAPKYSVYDVIQRLGYMEKNSIIELDYVDHKVDEIDFHIIRELQDDFYKPLRSIASKLNINKSTLSYHFRRHVDKVIRLGLEYGSEDPGKFPRIFGRVTFRNREIVNKLLRADFIYRFMPTEDYNTAYVVLELSPEEFWSLVRISSYLRSKGLMESSFLGFIDPHLYETYKLPYAMLGEDRFLVREQKA